MVKITLGNHDTFSEVSQFYKNESNKGENELYYTDEDDDFKYVYLDSSSYEISDTQFEWMIRELKTEKQLVIFIHHPILHIESEMDNKYPLKGREKIEESFKQHKKHLYIFCGHYHTHHEKTVGNITQFITPASSFQILKQPGKIEFDTLTFGYRIINIVKGEIDTEVVLLA
jgi:hypothetical protein